MPEDTTGRPEFTLVAQQLALTGLQATGAFLGLPCPGECRFRLRADSFFPCRCAEARTRPASLLLPIMHYVSTVLLVADLTGPNQSGHHLSDGRIVSFETLGEAHPTDEAWNLVREAHALGADGLLIRCDEDLINLAVFPYRVTPRLWALDGQPRCPRCDR